MCKTNLPLTPTKLPLPAAVDARLYPVRNKLLLRLTHRKWDSGGVQT
ncbi:MAG: hypothetical protein GW873_05255 [Nitrospirae bacterium]|nr:hypothetical protein [Nitrospirota bacterium]